MSNRITPPTPREILLEAEATLTFIVTSNAANDPNADVVVKDLVTAVKRKITLAIEQMDSE